MHHDLARSIARAALCLSALVVLSCGGRIRPPEVTSDPYLGPALTLDSSGKYYTVVVQSPSPGWVVTLDHVNEAHRHEDVFVTLRKPDPRFLYSSQVVEQRLLLPLVSTSALRVCARVLDYDAPAEGPEYHTVFETPLKP